LVPEPVTSKSLLIEEFPVAVVVVDGATGIAMAPALDAIIPTKAHKATA
jgi:hypothetical protein